MNFVIALSSMSEDRAMRTVSGLFLVASSNSGNSLIQGAHQLAQKLRMMVFPLKSVICCILPVMSVNLKLDTDWLVFCLMLVSMRMLLSVK